MKISEEAVTTFKSGFNCAQSVLSVYTDKFDLDKNIALRMAAGFGAGMGRLHETCGAVTGAIMVIGLQVQESALDKDELKEKAYCKTKEFSKKFTEINGTTNCGKLINCDLSTPEGQEYFKENDLYEKVCAKCVKDAVEILEDMSFS